MISLITYKTSCGSFSCTVVIILTTTYISSSMVVCIISISIPWLLLLVDCWRLIHHLVGWIILHVQCIIYCIMWIFLIDCTPFIFWIFHIERTVHSLMWGEFLAYLTKIFYLYYSNIFNFVLHVPTIVFCMSFFHEKGAPYICISQRKI